MKLSIDEKDYLYFIEQYNCLPSKKDIFYMYFTSKLLHYAMESTEYVPDSVNLVIITAGLTEDEIIYMNQKLHYPIIHLGRRYNDGHIWEMLFTVNEYNFGWLDVDCFVADRSIFEDIVKIGDRTAINTIWARKHDYYGIDCYFANTFMQFINIKIAKIIMDKYPKLNMTPIYINPETIRWYEVPRFLDESEKELLLSAFPHCGSNKKGFDTTHYYQMLVMMNGYKIDRVRELSQLEQYYSKEAIHLGGCNMIHTYLLDKTARRIFYRFNMRYSYYLLRKRIGELPEIYLSLLEEFNQTMENNKLSTDMHDIVNKLLDYISRNDICLKVSEGDIGEKECFE